MDLKQSRVRPQVCLMPVTVGKLTSHTSHKLMTFNGNYYCDYCGCYTSNVKNARLSTKGLAGPCDPSNKPRGPQNLTYLREGTLPPVSSNRTGKSSSSKA